MISVAPKTPMSRSTPTFAEKDNLSPTSSSSPSAISMNINMSANSNANAASSRPITKIVMSKEWVLPPRPKPGRKPCDDIPSSKRKAQNRAAQRAFRERRANRVSELEEKIMEMERDRSVSEGILNNLIKNLQAENAQLKTEITNLKNDNNKMLSKHKDSISLNINTPIKNSPSPDRLNSLESLFNLEPQSAVPLKRKASSVSLSTRSFSKGEIDFTNAFVFKKQRKMPVLNDIFLAKNGNSQSNTDNNSLIKNEIDINEQQQIQQMQQTPRSSIIPSNIATSFAMNNSNNNTASSMNNTASNMNNTVSSNNNPVISNNIPFESCGFCSEDTPCVCREIETEQQLEQQRVIKNIRESKLKIEIEKKERELILELTRSADKDDMSQIAKCTGNPGTCLQCRSDPLSTLFCKTVAEKSSKEEVSLPSISREGSINITMNDPMVNISSTPLSNSASLSNSNSNSNSNISGNMKYRLPSLESLKLNEAGKQFVPCADAYKTISNHLDIRNVGVNNIANNLHTKGMFVEVGSVVSCLRELDRKFSSS